MKTIKQAKQLYKKGRTHAVCPVPENGANVYKVISGTSGSIYWVVVLSSGEGATCSCPWGQYRPDHDIRSACSHVQAVVAYREKQKQRSTSAWTDEEQAKRQHRPIINLGDGVLLTSRKAGTE